ncbi:MAG: zf-HC2 domain-containing protein [Gammaproteobacteria bacterium]|nr:zf-HC2 domain-containing protein [Gammaproteobacteria bacterium]
MPSCKEVSELVSQSLDRKLSLRERASVRLHLMMCHMCAAYRRQIEFMHDAVRRLGRQAQTQGTLSDEAKARIKKRIEERQ